MGHLFLSGGGDQEQTKAFDRFFAEKVNKDKPLLYIPVAMETTDYNDCLEWIKTVFNPLGIRSITMWTDLNNKSVRDLQSFSAIYIGGGNTFSLLKNLRTTKFDGILKEYLKNDGILYAGSAGAIIAGADIMTCAHMDPNNVNLQETDGLKLINNYSVWCHYSEQDDQLIKAYIKDYKNPVIALSEETGVYYCDGNIKVIGEIPSYVFNKLATSERI